MVLTFMKEFPHTRNPTAFREKILLGIMGAYPKLYQECMDLWPNPQYGPEDYIPKNHTIRLLPKSGKTRYREGQTLQFRQWTGRPYHSPQSENFAPELPITKLQIVEINSTKLLVKIDGRELEPHEVLDLARNDGFSYTRDFYLNFNKPATYILIHWLPDFFHY